MTSNPDSPVDQEPDDFTTRLAADAATPETALEESGLAPPSATPPPPPPTRSNDPDERERAEVLGTKVK